MFCLDMRKSVLGQDLREITIFFSKKYFCLHIWGPKKPINGKERGIHKEYLLYCIYREGTAPPFVFNTFVFFLRKPEPVRQTTTPELLSAVLRNIYFFLGGGGGCECTVLYQYLVYIVQQGESICIKFFIFQRFHNQANSFTSQNSETGKFLHILAKYGSRN